MSSHNINNIQQHFVNKFTPWHNKFVELKGVNQFAAN